MADIDPRVKIAILSAFAVANYVLLNPILVAATFVLAIVTSLKAGEIGRLAKTAWIISPFFAFIAAASWLIQIANGVPLAAALGSAILLSTMLMGTALLAVLLVYTIRIEDLVLTFTKLGIPYKFAYAVSLAARLLHVISSDLAQAIESQISRGVIVRGGIRKMFFAYRAILLTLVAVMVLRSVSIAEVLISRGFGTSKRTFRRSLQIKPRDYFFFAVCFSYLGTVVALMQL
ncbi:MAG: energy-coupling factor transporter transmembrane component T [Candidatus Bathyarchaeia archaeon]